MKITSIIPIEVPFGDEKFIAKIRLVTKRDIERQRADALKVAETQLSSLELQEQLRNADDPGVRAEVTKTLAGLRLAARENKPFDIVSEKLVSIGPDDTTTGLEGEVEVEADSPEGEPIKLSLDLTKKADALTWAKTDMRAVHALTTAIAESQRAPKTGN